MFSRTDSGQATVEAAFLIPVLFIVLLMLLQPGIVLYDRMVMSHAAAEGCRLAATVDDGAGVTQERCEELVRRRLGAIPQHDIFHVHDGGCSYLISVQGSGSSATSKVTIENKVRLLPLFDATATLAGLAEDGCVSIRVSRQIQTQPDWVLSSSSGMSPDSWVHERD